MPSNSFYIITFHLIVLSVKSTVVSIEKYCKYIYSSRLAVLAPQENLTIGVWSYNAYLTTIYTIEHYPEA